MRRTRTLQEAFWALVQRGESDGCWEWLGGKIRGYGRFQYDHARYQAHRLSYELLVGPIPEGLTLDHLCRNRSCVNPAHLEPVTNGENVLRGESIPARNARKTTCIRGHDLTNPDNLYKRKYGRQCKVCATDIRREKKGQYDQKLFCRQGHPRTPENTYTYPAGNTVCLPCARACGLKLEGPKERSTHCPKGHAFTPENTYEHSRGRYCRECNRIAARERYRGRS